MYVKQIKSLRYKISLSIVTHWFAVRWPRRQLSPRINKVEPSNCFICLLAVFQRTNFDDIFGGMSGEQTPPEIKCSFNF